jgi:hypothetical protein
MVLATLKTLSKNASGAAKVNDEKYHKGQTAFSPESNLGSSGYEERAVRYSYGMNILLNSRPICG